MMTNRLYYGDNLEILRKEIRDESVDLIYLDPPFNSKRDLCVLYGLYLIFIGVHRRSSAADS